MTKVLKVPFTASKQNEDVMTIDPFHNNIQFEAKDVIPCAARTLHGIITLQLHVQNNIKSRQVMFLEEFRKN